MHRTLIIGAGKIGAAIAKLLHHSGDYEVCVADHNSESLKQLKSSIPIKTKVLDVTKKNEVDKVFKNRKILISAGPFYVNSLIAQAALKSGASYFDLTEDRATTKAIREIAKKAEKNQIFMPQCGLAPGFIGILASDLIHHFDSLEDVKMRVGALPEFPSNKLMYNLTWSTDGLINEYCNPCEAIHSRRVLETTPLKELEFFSLDGVNYEAFNTSGGLGTLCETLSGKVRNLDYKTVRYKGHQYLMSFLIEDLNLGEKRDILKRILEEAVPITMQDVILVFCTVSGYKNGKFVQKSDARKIYNRKLFDEHWSSIQLTTAAGVCAVVDLYIQGKLPNENFIRQEFVSFQDFLNNRFGSYYKTDQKPGMASFRVASN